MTIVWYYVALKAIQFSDVSQQPKASVFDNLRRRLNNQLSGYIELVEILTLNQVCAECNL